MKVQASPETVTFTTKGQVVIPARLRREYAIEEGTRATVVATEEGILLKPITALSIRQAKGMLATGKVGKSLKSEWAEHKRSERELEKK